VTQTGAQKYAFFQGSFVPLEHAKVSVMTHAFNYGTGVFEGIRGYWNEQDRCVYILRLREHYVRFLKNTRMVCIEVPFDADELVELTLKLMSMHDFREDVYIRPLAYKSSEQIGVSMKGVKDDLTIFCTPFGNYIDIDRGLSLCVSSWKRTDDNAIPGRAKVTGNYVNSALVKNEALMNGFDEGICLNSQGFVVEGSTENIFIVRDGALITPSVADGILEGITRDCIISVARDELGLDTMARPVARTELYYADEVFLTGTGAQVAPVTSIDHRAIGKGDVGPVTGKIQTLYLDAVRGRIPRYMDWLTRANITAMSGMARVSAR